MLKGVDHRVSAEMLHALRAIGHGDTLVLADKNFPSDSISAQTRIGKPLPMDSLSSAEVTQIILSLMPLDTFVDDFAMAMEIVGNPSHVPTVQSEVQNVISAVEGKGRTLQHVERFDFYERAKAAYAVVQTGETRFYGCFIFRKGVIAQEQLWSAL